MISFLYKVFQLVYLSTNMAALLNVEIFNKTQIGFLQLCD